MLFEEVELLLLLALAFEQLADGPQTVGPVGQCHTASLFQRFAVMFSRQSLQPHQDPHGLHAAGLRGRFRPLPGVRPDRGHLPQQGVGAALHGGDFFLRDVLRIAVRKRPGSVLACTTNCSQRSLKIRTSRPSQRTHSRCPTYSGGAE